MIYNKKLIQRLNKDIERHFPHIFPIESHYEIAHSGVSRLVMLDRYAQKDINNITLKIGDLVVCVVRDDPKFPSRGIGYITKIDPKNERAYIELEEEFRSQLNELERDQEEIIRPFSSFDKPLEIYYEQ